MANAYTNLKGKDLESALLFTQEADGVTIPQPEAVVQLLEIKTVTGLPQPRTGGAYGDKKRASNGLLLPSNSSQRKFAHD